MAGFKLRSKYKAHGFWISPVCPLSSLVQSVRCWNTCQHALTPTSIQSFHFSANLPRTHVTCLSCTPLLANGSHRSCRICTWPCPSSQQIGSCGFLVQVGQWVVILGAGKSSIKVPAGLGSGVGSPLGLRTAAFPLCPVGRDHASSLVSLLIGHKCHQIRAPPLKPHLTFLIS